MLFGYFRYEHEAFIKRFELEKDTDERLQSTFRDQYKKFFTEEGENLDRRIITSSAKPEKRIVAHKASIIEIVKITIEGAHEPISSSYSSGQSIYFGFNDFRQIPV